MNWLKLGNELLDFFWNASISMTEIIFIFLKLGSGWNSDFSKSQFIQKKSSELMKISP